MQRDFEPTEEQKDAAALWLVKRAGGSMSAEDEVELEAWLNRDRGNRLAFDRMRVLWAQLEVPARRLAEGPASGLLAAAAAFLRPRRVAAFAGAFCVACAAVWFFNPNLVRDWQADIVSGREVATLATLPDGSRVVLGANTALRTEFSDGRREVSLLHGQAFFDVEHREDHPFVVHSGDSRIRVVGTRFDVDRLAERVVVSVVEGAVRVRGGQDRDGVLLAPGQQVAVSGAGAGPVVAVDLDLVLSWMEGRISVENARVADFAAVLERYGRGRILVLDSIADRRISGSFPANDVAGSLETVADATGATLVRTSPWLTVIY